MTTYEAVPNTDGQILIPIRKKQPVRPQNNSPRTLPPSQRPSGKRIPVRRFGAPLRPRSPPFQRPVYKSKIRTPEALRRGQSQKSKYNSNRRLEAREFANGRLRAISSSTHYLKDSNTRTLSSHASNQSIRAGGSKFLRRKETPLIKSRDNKHANVMSLSYIMDQRPSAQESPSASDEIEESVIDVTAYSQSEEECESEDEGREETSPLTRNIPYSRHIPCFSNFLHHIPNQTNVASLQNSLLNTPMKLEEIKQAVRSFEYIGDKETSGTMQFRARRKLPEIEGRGAAYLQYHPNYMASSPLTFSRSISRTTASPDLSTLEHTAITTLASLNGFFDSKSLYPSATMISGPNPNSPAPINESDQTYSLSLKRPSSHISSHIPTESQQSTLPALLATTELDPSTKRIRISSILDPTPPLDFTSPNLQSQSFGSLCSDTSFPHDSPKFDSDLENNNSMPSQYSEAYPSPPKSASLPSSSVPLRTSLRPFDPRNTNPKSSLPKGSTNLQSHLDSFSDRAYRSPAPSSPSFPEHKVQTPALTETASRSLVPMITDKRKPNPTPQSQLLFFNHQAYSPLPARSPSIIRSSSPPLSSSPSSTSTSPSSAPKSNSNSLPRKNFAYRAWKLRPSRSVLTNLSDPNFPQYLVVIRNEERSKSTPSLGALDKNGNASKWWSILAGKEGLDEIRKIFE
ncbi:hypothetical protein BOTCAL_0053g00350 [Botryotinia calthae]|uniref:Uncharacterized protein n=1 Tax=Botryotinia calthae TaxID=38488 RepID=A0A4Y8DB48_9HELO|nr:hypothetical protein BOTCAL_0053g00350 [Botryotinia calthae]